MKDMRAFSGYQLDPNHSHCGPRKLLRDGLDLIEKRLSENCLGVCYRCWRDPASEHAWGKAMRPPFFNGSNGIGYNGRSSGRSCDKAHQHEDARDFFVAMDRGWGILLSGR